MKYRLTFTMILDSEADAETIYRFLEDKRGIFRTIKKGKPEEERSSVRLERCYHDEEPPKPCEVIKEFTSD